ncbi:MAG TPA: cell surface protein SprA [Gemmatimonadaceae bacterium]|nr:cell surface protein SprA [Gemmatimonadaceae bacterium]
MRFAALIALLLPLAPALVEAQAGRAPPRDSTRASDSAAHASAARRDTVPLRIPPLLRPSAAPPTVPGDALWPGAQWGMLALGAALSGNGFEPTRMRRLWRETARERLTAGTPYDTAGAATVAQQSPDDSAQRVADVLAGALTPHLDSLLLPAGADSTGAPARSTAQELLSQVEDLSLAFQSRMELKAERNRDERCIPSGSALDPVASCRSAFQPQVDFQFGVRSTGTVADRVHVDVDYDSQREFDTSNDISIAYQGNPGDRLERLELGNVSFELPPSRFLTGNVPSGNYGVQAIGHAGPLTYRAIYAQQKGNVVRDRVYTIGGDRSQQAVDREIEDYQVERRRFFWVVDPKAAFRSRFPNVDILDPQLASLSELPQGERPRRVIVYRYRPPTTGGSVTRDINGPFAHTRGARNTNEIGPYEVLQQGVDYYLDPSNLWIALVTPVNRGERLAVSYTVTGPGGEEEIVPSVGGTFPTQRNRARSDTVLLLWDSEVLPGDSVFNREIRSVYRLGGGELDPRSIALKIVIGSGTDQERPLGGGSAPSLLSMFGLAQRGNTSAFDVDNRLWPRLGDPNQAVNAGGAVTQLIRDYFVVFPSLHPFGSDGLVVPPNPANDSLYATADEDLVSQRRPPTQYRIRAHFDALGSDDPASLALGSVQVRAGSERVLVDGIPLTRNVDYRVDYELGRVTFTHPDTLFARSRQVSVQYEELPFFAATPTNILGLTTRVALEHGEVNFTAISQEQESPFTRPQLGFEPRSGLVAGITTNLLFPASGLTRALNKLPFVSTDAPSTVQVQGEFAASRPRSTSGGVAFLESFEGEGGIRVNLDESVWRVGSRPDAPGGVLIHGTPYDFAIDSASTLVWQNIATVTDTVARFARGLRFFAEQIDSQFVFAGGQAFRTPETVLWTTLFPRDIGGIEHAPGSFLWQLPDASAGAGRRWRSISQNLSPNGVDLTRVEQLEFWALVDTSTVRRGENPTLVIDFGDISENSIAFAPDSLITRRVLIPDGAGGTTEALDSTFTGRRLVGFDRMDSERDTITRSFDAARNDTGIPGDVADTLVRVALDGGGTDTLFRVPLCTRGREAVLDLGDPRVNCTVGDRRLNEEDLDIDGFLNQSSSSATGERILRYVVDLSDPSTYTRVGQCFRSVVDTTGEYRPTRGNACWVQVRIPFNAPAARINDPLVRRIKSMRLTVVSGNLTPPDRFIFMPIARLRLTGSPWVKRSEQTIAGIAGSAPSGSGFVVASVIGTQDRNTAAGIAYESPPGVGDEPDTKQTEFDPGQIQVNERSLRLLTGNLPLFHRAEALIRFPEGEKNFMGYRELRVWARGRNKGWGEAGDLQFYIKMGRDEDNFYMVRSIANAGSTREAWLPEVHVDFRKLFALRAQLENNFLHGGDTLACHGLDSALVVNSPPPTAPGARRFAACSDGYIVYSANPAVTPPNLAAVQELAVGIVRIRDAGQGSGGPITPTDTLELWVDDIRLGNVVDEAGFAGQVGVNIAAADVGTIQVNAVKRDHAFREFTEQPSFVGDDQLNVLSSLRIDKLLPKSLGLVLPFSVSYARTGTDPFFLSRSDISAGSVEGLRTPGTSATAYTLAVRRATPLANPVMGALMNHLALTSTYATANSRTEFESGRSSSFTGGLEYDLEAPDQRIALPGFVRKLVDHLPGWLQRSDGMRALRNASVRWSPVRVHFTSGYARTSDRRTTFALPIATDADSGRGVSGSTMVLRNGGTVELRPFQSLSARVDLSSTRDLRDYGDTSTTALAAAGERQRFLGMDVGLERERQMSTTVSATPPVTSWLKPRFEYSTAFFLLRDPQARTLVQVGGDGSGGELRLPRRLANSQGLGAGATLDFSRAVAEAFGDSSFLARLVRGIRPFDVAWRRDLRSTFDGVGFDPSLGYQLALGGVDGFRQEDGVLATSAGATHALTITHTVDFPFGLSVVDRFSRVRSRSWSRIVDEQALLTSEQRTFPDLSGRWSFAPPLALRGIITSIGAQAGLRITRGTSFQPTLLDAIDSAEGIRFEQTVRQVPLNASVTWALLGGFSTAVGWNHLTRSELRSGGTTTGSQDDFTAEVGKVFRLPDNAQWKGNTVRTRIGFQQSQTQSFFLSGDTRRRVTDNGRWSVDGSADSDVTETTAFGLTLSHVVNFDENLDRRFTQTVLSAVLRVNFYSGDFR